MRIRHDKDADGNIDYVHYFVESEEDERQRVLRKGYDKLDKPIISIIGDKVYTRTKGNVINVTTRFVRLWEVLSNKPVHDDIKSSVEEYLICLLTHGDFNIESPFDIVPELVIPFDVDEVRRGEREKIRGKVKEKVEELRQKEERGEELKKGSGGSKKSLRKAVVVDKTSYEAQHGYPTSPVKVITEEIEEKPKRKSLRRRSK